MEFYTIKDIASMLNLNEETVRRWIREGKLKGENIGGRTGYRISKQEFDNFLLDNKKFLGIVENNIQKEIRQDENISRSFNTKRIEDNLYELIFDKTNKKSEEFNKELLGYEFKLQMNKKRIIDDIRKLENELEFIQYELGIIEQFK